MIKAPFDEIREDGERLHVLIHTIQTRLDPSNFKDEDDTDTVAWKLCQLAEGLSEDFRTIYMLRDEINKLNAQKH